MAQLIKLQDYVSRYAQDIYLYPSRYVRLKKKQWEGLKEKWETGPVESFQNVMEQQGDKQPSTLFQKLKHIVRQPEEQQSDPVQEHTPVSADDQEPFMDPRSFHSISHIKTEDALKKHFLDELFPFQLKWASSTLTERSFVAKEYTKDPTLKFLLQRFPDTFLVLYKPIFLLKKAPVEAELILITPASAICISFIEAEEDAVFVGSKERFWTKKTKDRETKILNPLIALNRTEKIVKTLFDMDGVELPVQKLLISRSGFIDYPMRPYGVQFIEKRSFEDWFMSLRGMKSPLKHMQLKAAQVLLQFCQTTSVRRLEWENSPGDGQ
ncbi:NERD domain-containing protein [Mesobacillus subterraneus]|uniref:NERD domain-containing protein n=1 Tax=Mesobacillus subterraneus TaxID=285983 RepID=A0A3R9FH00_9BACI|nr:NERD domain-containing protein [Mesobacillus subterraneus]RSD27774.1 NERD domain-containing protein [Mesobacillus subterraneus]